MAKQPKKSEREIRGIIKNITLPDRRELFVGPMGNGFYVQVRYLDADIYTGDVEMQHARKWYISRYSTTTEIVRTCYKAALTSYEHYLGEHFLYCGFRVMSPHFDVEALINLCDDGQFDARIPLKRKNNV